MNNLTHDALKVTEKTEEVQEVEPIPAYTDIYDQNKK